MKKYSLIHSSLALLFAFVACTPGATPEDKNNEKNGGNQNNPKELTFAAVDLGLSVKWANMNVSAKAPEDYGDYFAWGETTTKDDFRWTTYKFSTNYYGPYSKYNTQSSYGTVDNKTILDPEDDAAHVKLGGKWRIPTYEEWTELCTKCTWTSTTQNGVKGRLVTASNGNSIFLPATGDRSGSVTYDAESIGYYWSSSLNTNDPTRAYRLNGGSLGYDLRIFGLSIRPVTE